MGFEKSRSYCRYHVLPFSQLGVCWWEVIDVSQQSASGVWQSQPMVCSRLSASPGMLSASLFLLWLSVIMPTLAGFGATWAVLATRSRVVAHPSQQLAWIWVIALAVMPGVVTAWTVWPFRLEFLIARPSLERLADQIAAGQAVSFPQNAGPFRLAASRVEFHLSALGLINIAIQPNGSLLTLTSRGLKLLTETGAVKKGQISV